VVTTVAATAGTTHRAGESAAVNDTSGADRDDAIAIVSAVGHELRSPLTSIRGYTSLLLNRWDRLGDDDKKLMLGQISHDAERVTRLINELLDISRLETGRLHLSRTEVDLPACARRVLAAVAAQQPELDATVDAPDGLPLVSGDADKVEQVLTNLVENAVKYGSPTGLRVEASLAGGSVAMTVRDQGPGIPEADLAHVFERWYQHGQGRPMGTGLGLWISKGIVEAHGGELTVASTEGEGAAFSFTLPVDAPTDA
jgi:signal transduction histidine kinase